MLVSAPRFIALALAAALTAGPAAFAAPIDAAPTATVRYGDLDLASPAGKAALNRRLNRAATSVCPAADPMRLETVGIARACRKAALSRIQNQARTAIATAESRQRFASAEPAGRPSGL